ncbi:polymorphic toxin-type HINT domain-containing protein [Streptomyces sp. NBC_00503]|uniref:polymorphic toxin-type HINT domain-containing protein n=1 Tax=Streptomyces sp. NBC_00503 TaxID=2903659 RepID=UPI002E81705E|nr:polymorphic toxin-type HINT domain-containing protein [Streptomyces sp. NBC_00503]WUD84459.1 polymorphic toxin-type HINT domain-containing protein [Streptomyces sp. NBC_00503]
MIAVLAVLISGLGLPVAEAAAKPPKVWVPPQTALPQTKPVKGSNAKPVNAKAPAGKPWTPDAKAKAPTGTATVPLGSAGGAGTDPGAKPVKAGDLPVWLSARSGSRPSAKLSELATAPAAGAGQGSLRVELKDEAKTRAAGVDGALVTLTDAAGTAASGKVQVGFDVSAWAKTTGANWGDRARVVRLPDCALTTPGAEGCTTRTPVASHRDATGRLVAEVDVPKATAPVNTKAPQSASSSSASPMFSGVLAPQAVALAVEPGPSGASGDFTATPLAPSASWQAGANAANFTYGYTVEVPSSIAGPGPSVGLGYDSSSIDGRTASTNAQASGFGEGWDWSPGSISRSYKGCKDAGIAESGDECWAGDILSLSLAGHAGQIVRDDTTCVYHLQGEDGTKIERLTGQRSAAWKGEGFKVTTTDGTQYYFGSNRLPGGDGTDPEAKSVSTVPVYFNSGQDKCLGTDTPANGTWQQLGWQWNLDYVVDPHQNLVTYRYEQEDNYYGRGGGQNNGTGTNTRYQRGSYPTWIGYGQRLPDQIAAKGTAKPAAQITINNAERCVAAGAITCDPAQRVKANAKSWPDTPIDQECQATGQCLNLSPTYFTTKKYTQISTEVWTGTAWLPVDSYDLKQSFQDPGDGTSPTLWLDSIQRTGNDGKTPITLPGVSFQPLQIPNRVDGVVKRPDGTEASAPSYRRPRIQTITTETGGQITVVYKAAECSRLKNTMPSSEDANTMACMPVKWYLPGQSYPDPVNDWFNKIVIQSVTQKDLVAGQVNTVTDYEYGGGIAWHRNDSEFTDPKTRTWDQFRGYATVTTRTGNGNASEAPRTQSVTTYLRGMDGDALANGSTRSVNVVDAQGGSIKDEDVLSGFVRQSQTYDRDGGTVVSDEVTTPWLGPVTATRNQSAGMPAITARAVNTAKVTTRAKLANGNWRTGERTSTYDGTLTTRPLQVDDNSDTSRTDQRLCTTFEYPTGPGGAVAELASRTLVVSGVCGQAPTTANTVGDTRSYFDNLPYGQVGATANGTGTEVLEKYDTAGKPVYRLNSTSSYDAYGRVTNNTNLTRKDATHPGGAVTTTTYTPDTGVLPSSVTHTNPLGWKSVTTLDIRRSQPLKTTDENNHVAERRYDALGRVVSVWQPGQDSTKDLPVRKFSYSMNGTNAPSSVLSQALMNNNSYTSSFSVYDGLGRIRQTQASTPSLVGGRMITDALFDSHGWQVKTSAAYYTDEGSPSAALFLPNGGVNPDSKIPSQTVSVFDGLGRTTASIFQSFGVEQSRSTTEYPGADETRATPPTGGFATATITNGLTSVLRQYKSNTPTGAYDETTYVSNTQGQELSRKDSEGNEWTFTYDLLGRVVKTSDPDSGTSTTVYDDSKNLVTATDARGKSATTVTDLLGRTIATYEGAAIDPAKQVGAFTYDTKALGKPDTTTRYVGGKTGSAYVTEITGYDGGYRPLGTKVTIPAAEKELAGTYQTTNTYDTYGQLKTAALPGIPKAGLDVETLAFGTDVKGNLKTLGGRIGSAYVPYLVDMRYDPYGQPIRATVGSTGAQIVSTIDYDAGTGRPVRTLLDNQTDATSHVDVLDYTYNPVGQLTSISNTQDGTARDLQCFTHDYLGRLTQAWTDTGTQTTAPQPSVRGIGGCTNSTGPAVDGTGKPSVGGPAPYWQQYTYDNLGNRKKLVKKDVTGNTANDTTVTQTFGTGPNMPSTDPKTGGGTGGPHALMTSTETSTAGTKVTSYTYDAAGNTAAVTSTPGTKALTWNSQGKLDKIVGTGESAGTSYLYDTSGNQLIRRDPTSTTLNLGTDQITLDTASGKVSNVRTYAAPGGLSITRTTTAGASTLTYQSSDHHGTGGVQFNATNLASVRRASDPFGNERGTQPAPGAWANDKGFVGGTKEKATGFTLLGAREYDPTTGRFISPDPIIDPGDPQQWNAYAYSNNDPINKTDPSGLAWKCERGETGCAQTSTGEDPTPKTKTPTSTDSGTDTTALTESNKKVDEAKKKRDHLIDEVVDMVGDLIGYNDARDCFTKGDVMACINTALNFVPWGKLFKAVKIGIKAFKIYKEINKAYDAVHEAERGAARAAQAYSTAKKALKEARAAEEKAAKSAAEQVEKETASDAAGTESHAASESADAEAGAAKAESDAPVACKAQTNSFPTGTRVQMADGTTKAIQDIRVGDTVMATDPQTGETRPKKVTATITTPDDKEFTDLTLTDDAAPRGPPVKITSTSHHPYWSETRHQWIDAGELATGEQLRQPNGTTLTVKGTLNYPYAVTTHNLTVDDFHTYYVMAANAPVLVHNCPAAGDDSREIIVSNRGQTDPGVVPDIPDPVNGGYNRPRGARAHSEAGASSQASEAMVAEAETRASTVARVPANAAKIANAADASGGSGGIVEAAAAASVVGWRAWQLMRGWWYGRRG